MSNFNEGSPLKDSHPQSGNTVEGYKEELSYQGQDQKQNHHQDRHQRRQQQPLPVGISPEPPSPPPRPPRPPAAAGIYPSKNLSYEEFIAADQKQQSFSSEYAETGFPKSWPKVPPPPPPPPPAKVAPPPVEPPSSPAKVFPPPANKASPPNGRRNVQPPPPPPRSCSCCIIL